MYFWRMRYTCVCSFDCANNKVEYYAYMDTLIKQLNTSLSTNKPVVVVPIKLWESMRATYEEMKEDLEMFTSPSYKKSIARARLGKKLYSPAEARKKLGL